MNCLFCQRKIGFWRRVADRNFCCADHRNRFPAFSSRANREKAAVIATEYSETWAESIGYTVDPDQKVQAASHASPALLGFFALLFIALAFIGLPGSSGPRASASPVGPPTNVGETLKNAIRNRAAVRFTDDFKTGLSAWTTPGASGGDWSFANGFVRPGRLRLWQQSMKMSDYQLEFQTQVESKGLGWVYRAQNEKNHYATRIVIARPGPLPAAEIHRYAMVNGMQDKKVRLPLPIQLRPDTPYRIQVSVRGDQFSTLVNGHMVDSWSDKRHRTGGVGFFTEKGEVASLRWVSISDRNTFVGRLFSYAQPGFFVPMYLPE